MYIFLVLCWYQSSAKVLGQTSWTMWKRHVFRLDTLQHASRRTWWPAAWMRNKCTLAHRCPHVFWKRDAKIRRKPCFFEVCGFDYWIGFSRCKHSIFNILLVLYDQWILENNLKWNKIDIYWWFHWSWYLLLVPLFTNLFYQKYSFNNINNYKLL